MNTPISVIPTPSVELFEAACNLVYVSGRRITPTAATTVKKEPPIKKSVIRLTIIISVIFNNHTFLQEFGKADSCDKSDHTDQHNNNEQV